MAGRTSRAARRLNWPGRLLEQVEQLFRNEARSGGIEVTIALPMLSVDEETLRAT